MKLELGEDGKGPPEAESFLDYWFILRKALQLTRNGRRGPTTASELEALGVPMRAQGATWADWHTVARRMSIDIRQQAHQRGVHPRDTGSAGFFRPGGMCHRNFSKYLDREELDDVAASALWHSPEEIKAAPQLDPRPAAPRPTKAGERRRVVYDGPRPQGQWDGDP